MLEELLMVSRFQNRVHVTIPFALSTVEYLKQWLPKLQTLDLQDCSGLRPRDLFTLAHQATSLRYLLLKNVRYSLSIQHLVDLFPQVCFLSTTY